jgi:hypothetical protein
MRGREGKGRGKSEIFVDRTEKLVRSCPNIVEVASPKKTMQLSHPIKSHHFSCHDFLVTPDAGLCLSKKKNTKTQKHKQKVSLFPNMTLFFSFVISLLLSIVHFSYFGEGVLVIRLRLSIHVRYIGLLHRLSYTLYYTPMPYSNVLAHGKDRARSCKNFNNRSLFYLNVCDFGSGSVVELQMCAILDLAV